MRMLRLSFLLILILSAALQLRAQQPADSSQVADTSAVLDRQLIGAQLPPTLIFDEEEEEEEDEEVEIKRKKNEFYGIRTRKSFARSGYGDQEKIEEFYLLREWEEPNPYVRDIYWYEYRSKSVKVGGTPTAEKGMLLHGPYKVFKDGQLIEQGILYKGMKHGRWTTHRKMYDYYVLDSKQKYYKGWPKESEISYYDAKATKLKEVTPIEYGKKNGYYYYFFEDGRLAVRGEYSNDKKVGLWTEYYPGPKHRRKKELRYPPDPWTKDFTPHTNRAWNEGGGLVYENK